MPNSRTVLQRGASTVELALVVPLLMGVAWGFVRVGNLLTQVYVAQQASYSAVLLGAEINADAETGLGLIQSRAELVVGHSANNMIPGNGDRYFEPSYVVNTEARLVEVDLVARVKDAAEATLPAALAQKLVAPLLTPRTVLDPTYEFQNGLGHYDCEGVWIGDSPLAQTCCNGGCSEDQGGSGSGDYGS
ncbi:MAG: hypothetical protein K1X83_07115, partial [Oligoflexia bacterium]|nr:hypothetical protein [Oligoflexia bacterium]